LRKIDFISDGITDNTEKYGLQLDFSAIRKEMKACRRQSKYREDVYQLAFKKGKNFNTSYQIIHASATWCKRNDSHWLKEICDSNEELKKIRDEYRSTVYEMILIGPHLKPQIRRLNPAIFEWCQIFDNAWLDSIIPTARYKQLAFEDKLPHCRRVILLAMEGGIRDRASMPILAKRWCLKYDRDWFELVAPCKNRGRKRDHLVG
jgi:hypothetical protein